MGAMYEKSTNVTSSFTTVSYSSFAWRLIYPSMIFKYECIRRFLTLPNDSYNSYYIVGAT